MTLTSFYFNKQDTSKLSVVGFKSLYSYQIELRLARKRLVKLFQPTRVEKIVDEVC